MRTRPPLRFALVTSLALLGALALSSLALAQGNEGTILTATLAGVTEGANPGDPDGTGSATILMSPGTATFCWELSVANISPVLQSHIHVGAAGVAGDVMVPLDVDGFTGTSTSCAPLTDGAVLPAIIANPAGYYVNIHTSDYPAGAIRGQLAANDSVVCVTGGLGISCRTPNTALTPTGTSALALLGVLLLIAAAMVGGRTVRAAGSRA